MKWISVDERTPKQGQIVLVIGDFDTQLSYGIEEHKTGLVTWWSKERSDCVDELFYSMWYSNITHWCEIPEQPKLKQNETTRKTIHCC